MSGHLSKLEECPRCNKDLGQKEYDFQHCTTCGWPAQIPAQGEPQVEVTERQGLRFRESTMVAKTVWNDTGVVTQTLESELGLLQKRTLHTMEAQARDALIALGWTPPPKR